MEYEVTYRVTGKSNGVPAMAHFMEKVLPRKINEWIEMLGFGCTVEILERKAADNATEKLTMMTLLNAVATDGTRAYEALQEEGYHPKVIVAKMEKAQRRGYLESGIVSHRCWLTEKGVTHGV